MPLLLLEALAVGALVHGGVGLVRADLDGVQTAVLGVLAVVGTVGHGAADGGVGRAGAAVVGMIGHNDFLLKVVLAFADRSLCRICTAIPRSKFHFDRSHRVLQSADPFP